MDKTERLYAVAEELRRVGPSGTTGARLARLLEVSIRTVKRDVSALQQAGLPIWAQAGPGGGYVLDASASLPPLNFTPQQAVAVAVALASLPPASPFAVDAVAAQRKVWDALGPQSQASAAELASRVWVAHGARRPAAEGHPSPADGSRQQTLRAVEQSLARSTVLAVRYRDSAGAETARRVEPVILAHTGTAWYLVAWCRSRRGIRWFRLERIARADLTAETFVPRPVAEAGEPPEGAAPVG
ncbi:WYL domain-containing protein [Sanguibacter sp. 4.1]|uniref:WYL domain-containing protein n=1 Tax=Sanguibacter biliveldensis TaxID=3030830 RepID=A0AAF0Z3G3_9MICO|nr:WYL domain-containing protein [Sanguibacter sp. 4.1]WPF82137.1 WYL domain-containing protein [Sanguibacter sp. 4.1]